MCSECLEESLILWFFQRFRTHNNWKQISTLSFFTVAVSLETGAYLKSAMRLLHSHVYLLCTCRSNHTVQMRSNHTVQMRSNHTVHLCHETCMWFLSRKYLPCIHPGHKNEEPDHHYTPNWPDYSICRYVMSANLGCIQKNPFKIHKFFTKLLHEPNVIENAKPGVMPAIWHRKATQRYACNSSTHLVKGRHPYLSYCSQWLKYSISQTDKKCILCNFAQ